jgi:hypothetical protein
MSRLWLGIFGAAFLVLGALVAATVATPAPVADLTRVAKACGHAFGWLRDREPSGGGAA